MPYVRGEKNDMRVAHEFLTRLAADGKKLFKERDGQDYVVREDAIAAFKLADRLLVSWGNRGSHTFDLVTEEAAKLIDACEAALTFFRCSMCDTNVWFATAGSKLTQCRCGQICWQYGKG